MISTINISKAYEKFAAIPAPFEYQKDVFNTLLNDKNIILSVPTGAGKTWTSIIPFLYAQENPDIHFPKKMIYSLPLRTLTNSIHKEISKAVENTSLQTGEFSEDRYFESDIIFSTIDQTLSNFLCFPLALSRRQANVNAGALIGSYLVFDEFHLLDNERSMATTLGMLKMLSNLSRCCIMTATLSDDFIRALKENLSNFEIITLGQFEKDKTKIGSLQPSKGKKKIQIIDKPISAKNVEVKHLNKSIVICNRVETAQKLYNDLIKSRCDYKSLSNLKGENIVCLHSRFFDTDRKVKEEKLNKLFGKNTDSKEKAILIATQVVEAGLDITCDVLHTEISPINSFLQRVGRCARFKNEKGQIFVYDVLGLDEKELINIEGTTDEDKSEINRLKNKYLPYDESICQRSLEAIKNYANLDGDIPQKLIESVLKEEEQKVMTQMMNMTGGGFNQNKIRESWNHCEKNHYRSTIRDIQSVDVILISEDMLDKVVRSPFSYQSIGIFKWSLVSWLNKIVRGESDISYDGDDWLVKELVESVTTDIFLENDEDLKFGLQKVTDFSNIPQRVFLNAKYFGYDPNFGFNKDYLQTFCQVSPKKAEKEKEKVQGIFTKDTFYQHNMGLIRCFEKEFIPILNFTFVELAKYIGSEEPPEEFVRLIYLMMILHDYGKLNKKWQEPMQHYQALKEGINSNEFKEILGHTDFDSQDKKDKKLGHISKLQSRPAHAGVGAYIAQEVIPEFFEHEALKSSVSMAIARHHSPLANGYPDFNIPESNYVEIKQLLKEFDFDIKLEKNDSVGNLDGFEYDGHEEHILYMFFARILRLCDQKATENLSHYFNEA